MSLIAIVDDDEGVCRATTSLLRSLGYQVSTFPAAEAFLKSGQLHETSCLITDVQMPGIAASNFRRTSKPKPIVSRSSS